MGNSRQCCGSIKARLPLFLVILAQLAISETVAFRFQDRLCQRQQQLWQRKRRRKPLCQIRERPGGTCLYPSIFTTFANVEGETTELVKQARVDPNRKRRRTILLEPPSSISRRSAATSMATTAASILFSIPAVAIAAEEQDNTATIAGSEDSTATIAGDSQTITNGDLPDASLNDAPVAKERTVEYTVQDFTVALPANWKVITKYDEKATKPPSTPTLFSAIDFNSGAVISVVREEACSVSDYAKASFDKSSTKNNSAAKKCDFVIKPTTREDGSLTSLFSIETYEKDASKLLIRHDDRDNAVLRGVSSIGESKLTGRSGFRRFDPEFSFSSDTTAGFTKTNSYSSSLLELNAITTIPTSGTYRDTMGLEQPNTIDRKVLAKAVVTTTKVTRQADAPTEIVRPPSNESTLLATEIEAKADESSTAEKTTESKLVASTIEDPPGKATSEATASVSGEEATNSESDVGLSTTENPPVTLTAEATTATTKEATSSDSDDGLSTRENSPVTLTAEATKASAKEAPETKSDAGPNSIPNEKVVLASTTTTTPTPEYLRATEEREANSKVDSGEGLSMTRNESTVTAVASTTAPATKASDTNFDIDVAVEKKIANISESSKVAETADTSRNQPEITSAAASTSTSPTATPEQAIETTNSENSFFETGERTANDQSPKASMMAMLATIIDEPTLTDSDAGPSAKSMGNPLDANVIEKAFETFMETAKDTVIENVRENVIEPAIEDVKETAKETAKEMARELLTENTEPQNAGADTSANIPTSLPTAELPITSPQAAAKPEETMQTASTSDRSVIVSDTTALPLSDDTLVAKASPTGSPATSTNDSPAVATPTTTTTTTVLSIWLSAPLDEWQKPVMGTRLNQIWDSVQFTDNIMEDSDNLAMLSDDEDSINTRLLLLNKFR